MTTDGLPYAYGPVPSRRLGKSLGINNIPAKMCSYACVYCQVGRTSRRLNDRCFFYPPNDLFREVRKQLIRARAMSERVDYLTFVPDGEPTLDEHLGTEIGLLKTLAVPIGVITNGSLLWRDDVREELSRADWVSLKIDAVEKRVWRRINRPHPAIRLSRILDGMRTLAKTFAGMLVTETMLVEGLNDETPCIQEIAAFLHALQPDIAYLSIPTRPPAEERIHGPNERVVNRAYHLLSDELKRVEYLIGYEGNAFAFTGDIEKDLLGITAVHPMREEAVRALLSRSRSSWEAVDRLVTRGDLVRTEYNDRIFYLRKFKKEGFGRTDGGA